MPTCHATLPYLPLGISPCQIQVVSDFFQDQKMSNEEEFSVERACRRVALPYNGTRRHERLSTQTHGFLSNVFKYRRLEDEREPQTPKGALKCYLDEIV